MYEALKKKMILLYKNGMSLRQLSKLTKGRYSHESIRHIIPDNVLRKRKNISRKEILKLFKKYKSCKEVAKKLEVSFQYIYRIIKEDKDGAESTDSTRTKDKSVTRTKVGSSTKANTGNAAKTTRQRQRA